SSVHYNAGDYELNITVPQINIIYRPRGYIDPSTWDAGVPAIFLDYNANMYRSYTGSKYGTRSNNIVYTGNIGMQTGFNAKGWRFRKRLNLGMSSRGSSHTQNLFGFAQTDIIRLQSSLTIGDSNTRGDIFDSYNIRGIILQSDERMLPEGLRNYVPVLRGVAETNAKVTITQRGQTVYQTIVPPGPFELTDVGAMGYGGDLEMTVTEADGRVRSQSIPFSAPPMLLHQGVSLFSVNAGELREDKLRTKPKVMQGVYQYGVGNMYTLYGGGQFAQRFYSMALGNAFNTPIGGLSLDVTHAKSQLSENKNKTGNSFRVGFSRYLETTNTDLTLAAYKYSTAGYYTFREASLERYAHSTNQESDYRAKQRLTLTIGQRLWNDAYLNFTGSMYQYWDNRPGTRQYSLT
ncbi:fimbrial biogenesis outer membrane usher protein, partial [Erwinia sp. 1181_3]|uniref:fimbria/pilus outer membrane usher protein n=1 Tax=Erwinia sp. 1181_3 TaxID=2605957 RepID=UPI0040597452